MTRLPRLLMIVGGCAVAFAALAQLRTIPDEAKSGAMRHLQDMVVAIDGVPQRLAPGAQIRDASNRVIVPTALTADTPVKYLVNQEGLVRRVWILTPEEAAKR